VQNMLAWVLTQTPWTISSTDIWRVAAGRASGVKLGGDDGGGGIDGQDEVASSRIVGTLASIIFPTPHKIQNDDRLPQHILGVSG